MTKNQMNMVPQNRCPDGNSVTAPATLATVPITVTESGVRPVLTSAFPIGAVTLDTDARPKKLNTAGTLPVVSSGSELVAAMHPAMKPDASTYCCQAPASSPLVSRSNCGITFTPPSTVMKLASPPQRGTTCW